MRTVSIARLEYFCCLPDLPDFVAFPDFSAEGDIHRVSEPLFRRVSPVGDSVFRFVRWISASFVRLFHLRLH